MSAGTIHADEAAEWAAGLPDRRRPPPLPEVNADVIGTVGVVLRHDDREQGGHCNSHAVSVWMTRARWVAILPQLAAAVGMTVAAAAEG